MNKPPMPELAGDEDFCKLITRGKIITEALELPTRCPMKIVIHILKTYTSISLQMLTYSKNIARMGIRRLTFRNLKVSWG